MMTRPEIEDAKARVRGRIREEREALDDEELQLFVEAIEAEMFDAGFTITRLKNKRKIARATLSRFREYFKATPKKYVNDLKMEEAAHLIRETDIKIRYISIFAGIRPTYFCTAFLKRYGTSPEELRKGDRESERACRDSKTKALGVINVATDPETDRLLAESDWLGLMALPSIPLQLEHVRRSRYETRAFVDLLGEKYLEEGRKCRKRGLEIAELAVESVEASAQELGQLAQELRCLTWARLANARRLVLDFSEADKAFERAEQLWNVLCPRSDKKVEAELLFLKGRLRFEQRRFDEALNLLDLAINRSYRAEDEILLVKSLVQRAEIVGYLDLPDPVIPDLERALKILEKHEGETRLRLGLLMGISYAYSSKGDYGKALEVLRGLEKFREVDPLLTPQLAWLRALARIGQDALGEAKDLLYQSREGFGLCQGDVYAAVVSLDLARLSLVQDEISSALRFASEALPVFERYGEYPEVLDILNIFRRALDLDTVTTEVLEKTRDCLLRAGAAGRSFEQAKEKSGKKEGPE